MTRRLASNGQTVFLTTPRRAPVREWSLVRFAYWKWVIPTRNVAFTSPPPPDTWDGYILQPRDEETGGRRIRVNIRYYFAILLWQIHFCYLPNLPVRRPVFVAPLLNTALYYRHWQPIVHAHYRSMGKSWHCQSLRRKDYRINYFAKRKHPHSGPTQLSLLRQILPVLGGKEQGGQHGVYELNSTTRRPTYSQPVWAEATK